MATLADLGTAVHAAVRAMEVNLGASRTRELDAVTTVEQFDAAVAANDTNTALDAARRIAEKAAAASLKPAAAEITDTLQHMDVDF